ncbi:centrosomal protein of 57 kDa [Dunckerocampus dactyliophorus]|uniref:centrosomal protein of 57 kDa n=1 Tax=Dunckerocampus dactyliophorus TaxID=161453 RepID=UPI002407148E|nr:centrosomal protein of 57 kDa [Dunckerocampus dactyliophorus]
METLSKTAECTRETELHPRIVCDNLSLPSYKDYPAHRPCTGTLEHQTPSDTYDPYRPPSPSKGYPETNSAAILSALRHLQEKIRRLELEKQHVDLDHANRGDAAPHPHAHRTAQKAAASQTDERKPTNEQYNCNQALVTQLAAAESRCVNLERQLGHMRKMLRNAKGEKSSLLKQQASMEALRSAHKQPGPVSEQVQLQKMVRLEQEYLRLTRTQGQAEVKIDELEQKLQEEEHQRKLLQDKAKQLQMGLEANRILLQSSSSRLTKERKSILKKQSSYSDPHYRLNLKDVPFVAGTSVGGSHSVRANVQSVLSLLKRHQPHLCNNHVLDNNSKPFCLDAGGRRRSDASSGAASSASGELSELLQALQEELRLMSLEQDELMRQLDLSVSLQERKQLEREQEQLLLKMERKGDQISKLYRHKIQMKKLRKEAHTRQASRTPPTRVSATVPTRGRSAGAVKTKPGEKSRCNLRLLKDMKALQTSLRT